MIFGATRFSACSASGRIKATEGLSPRVVPSGDPPERIVALHLPPAPPIHPLLRSPYHSVATPYSGGRTVKDTPRDTVPNGMAADQHSLTAELRRDRAALDRSCRLLAGITQQMWRSIKWTAWISSFALGFYFVHFAGAQPTTVMVFLAILWAGPEAVEEWLTRAGQIDPREIDRLREADKEDDD